jgi:hypothetical protein
MDQSVNWKTVAMALIRALFVYLAKREQGRCTKDDSANSIKLGPLAGTPRCFSAEGFFIALFKLEFQDKTSNRADYFG